MNKLKNVSDSVATPKALHDTAKSMTPKYVYDSSAIINMLAVPIRVKVSDTDYYTLQRDCLCLSDTGIVIDVSCLKLNQSPKYFLTAYDLYITARNKAVLTGKIRIADGMAVSYYPTIRSIKYRRNFIEIDLSQLTPIPYDDLAENETVFLWDL